MSNVTSQPDLVTELERAHERVEQAGDRVAEFGESELEELASVYREFTGVLERYEDEVTDDGGDYQTNIEFQSAIAEVLEHVSADLLLSETFEECDEALQKKWFNESDFAYVREQLEPVADLVARLEERDEARTDYRETRREIRQQIRDLDGEIVDLERLSRLGDADLDAPTERLREPIRAYDEAVVEAFEEFRRTRPAREVIDFVDAMSAYPLVPFAQPDEKLRSYVREYPPGEETIPDLLAYAGYSRSKLDHYVDDPGTLIDVVGGRQTYLDGLDAEPLTIGWPPPSANELEWRCRELTAAANRFAPDVVGRLRAVAALPRGTDYGRLRDSALARESLTDAERERIKSEDLDRKLETARDERARLKEALDEHPSL